MEHDIHIVDGIGMLDPNDSLPPVPANVIEEIIAAMKAKFDADVKRMAGEENA